MSQYESEMKLHSLLQFNDNAGADLPRCPLLWDVRSPPTSAKHLPLPISSPSSLPLDLTPLELAQPATSPPVARLIVKCGIFLKAWPIEARNSNGVSVLDVLNAIYLVVITQIKPHEWDPLSEKDRHRIAKAFYERWQGSADPQREKSKGVRRGDYLVGYAIFSGMEIADDERHGRGTVTCVLSLGRNKHRSHRSHVSTSISRPLDSESRTEGDSSVRPDHHSHNLVGHNGSNEVAAQNNNPQSNLPPDTLAGETTVPPVEQHIPQTPPGLPEYHGNTPIEPKATEHSDPPPLAPPDTTFDQGRSDAPAPSEHPIVQPTPQTTDFVEHDRNIPMVAEHNDIRPPVPPDTLTTEASGNPPATTVGVAVQPVLQAPPEEHISSTPTAVEHHDHQPPAPPDQPANEAPTNTHSTGVRPVVQRVLQMRLIPKLPSPKRFSFKKKEPASGR